MTRWIINEVTRHSQTRPKCNGNDIRSRYKIDPSPSAISHVASKEIKLQRSRPAPRFEMIDQHLHQPTDPTDVVN
jgi:hypothetical protein